MTAPYDRDPASAEGQDGEHTQVLDTAGRSAPRDTSGYDDPDYSATVLGSQWIQRPDPDTTLVEPDTTDTTTPVPRDATPVGPAPVALGPEGTFAEPDGTSAAPHRTLVEPDATSVKPDTTLVGPTGAEDPLPPPDRTDGTVLRFGPGVTATVAQRTHRTLPTMEPLPAPPRRRRLRRHALPALVLLCVIAFLAWQRLGPSVEVRTVAVKARPTVLGCDETVDLVGLVTTDGRPGTLTYRWTRSDGTESGVLREVMVRGQTRARLHLLWTFEGKGRQTARVDLHILTPSEHRATKRFTYTCP
ncbi:hypothetical protein [Streptomyces sp. HM190]|uniref:hypothetical protein n=1 Tax=Streptomyces sp. HM190 TaxID=2695266 RepID=UPI001F3F7AB3|nr:hypothetical protein [Streptomyces sp. HM190]